MFNETDIGEIEYIGVHRNNSHVSLLFSTGGSEGRHLDGRVSDHRDVCRAAGCHRGGSAEDWRSV